MNKAGHHHGHFGQVIDIGVSSVLELIDRTVTAHPDALAVHERARQVTYGELDRMADHIASRLARDFGIGPGQVVMIAAEAGYAFTATLLGVMRAGAAYLPVDITYPAHRIAQILHASRADLLVTADLAAFNDTTAAADVALRVSLPDLMTGSTTSDIGRTRIRREVAPEDAAYVIFSSGSTGTPKGIVQTHRCLANFIAWQVEASGLGRGRQVLQVAPLTFDVSVQEIFYTLASGGCLNVPEALERRDPRELIDFIIDRRIEVVDLPQSLIDVIMQLPTTFQHAPALRHIISAGETVKVTPELDELLRGRPELTLHNHYGPAENHMVASHSMSQVADNLEPRPPVGSMVWNTYVYLLDDEGAPVADGEVGEVFIGGVGVSPGYTDPALDAAAFVPDPFRPGARLYRTRDRGVWRADETLQLLGRIDDLVKIRGNAVEPSEVDAVLATFPGVQDAATFASVGSGGMVELHAALIGVPPPASEIRATLLRMLPDYMVPVRWWLVPRFPISPNGKLDRTALPGVEAHPLSLVPHQPNNSR